MYGGQIQQRSQQYLSPNTEANLAIIVEEAEKLFDKAVKDCTNKIITDHTFKKSSLPLLPPPSNEEQK